MSQPPDRVGVVFVCLGNICRSPLAEGAFRAHVTAAGLADRFDIDSAGTGAWHVGEPPDPRSIEEAAKHGIDISALRGRQFDRGDFARFAHVIAMDRSNRRDLLRHARSPADEARVTLLLSELSEGPAEVPDPYYGARGGFGQVWRLVDAATAALLERLRKSHKL